MVSVDQFGIEIWQNYRHRKIIFRQCWFFIFQYTITINPIQRYYSHQHHSSSSAINTLLLYVSFKSTFVDFAFVFNMLALSAVFILSSLCACVLFSLSATKLSFDLLYQVLVPGSVLLSQKTRHKAQLTFYLS